MCDTFYFGCVREDELPGELGMTINIVWNLKSLPFYVAKEMYFKMII